MINTFLLKQVLNSSQRVLSENQGSISTTAGQLNMYQRTLQRNHYKKPLSW